MDVVALHMSDGLIDPRASTLFYVVAAIGLCLAAWCARSDLRLHTVPVAALVTALIFALHTVAVPILPGVSGHVVGAAIAAILLGPFVGALSVAIVLTVQSFVFADGGLSALGANVTNMALAAVAAGFLVAVALRVLLERRHSSSTLVCVLVCAAAGFVSVFAATAGFIVEYALGGATVTPLENVAYLFAVHIPVALVDGIVTALVVGAVARLHPASVFLFGEPDVPDRTARRSRSLLLTGLAFAALVTAGIVSPLGASGPDALEAATLRGCSAGPDSDTGECMARRVEEHRFAGSALAGYTVGDRPGSDGAAAVIGTLGTFVVAGICFRLLAPRERKRTTVTAA
ncbi:cobalamin biosynthesis protein cbim [Rhodococcus coprophilus]|uniref:Cobalamin biosynthesis protein cbim n=2 Tax=Rhodococcus coprophilus TaxID=38310 RepID=A0A2X4U7D7_9NOCA|nr:cobalamin biosynthesis protein cbim [Rhodococcus coprophilus]